MADLLVADQGMLETLQFSYYEVVYLREETARPSFTQLAIFCHAQKTTL
jgi:hypothetical protein